MNKYDRKQIILKIILENGPLKSKEIFEEATKRISDYNDQMIYRDLKDLRDNNLVTSRNNFYSSKSKHNPHYGIIEGSHFLDNLGGKISCRINLNAFKPKIENQKLSLSKERAYFIIEFNSQRVYLSIDMGAIPFRIHISRKMNEDENYIFNTHGDRTIVVKLPIGRLSAYRDEEKSGHVLISFGAESFEVIDLGSTNKPSIIKIPELDHDLFLKDHSLVSSRTINRNHYSHHFIPLVKTQIQNYQSLSIKEPCVLNLTDDCIIAIFF